MSAARNPNTGRTLQLALAMLLAGSLAACESTPSTPSAPPVITPSAEPALPLIVDNQVAGMVQITVLRDDYEFPVGTVGGRSLATFDLGTYAPGENIRFQARMVDENSGDEAGVHAAPAWVSGLLDLNGAQWLRLTLSNDLYNSTLEVATEAGMLQF